MALYINKQEFIHRICNGFITHDGYIDEKFFDIWKANGFDYDDKNFCRMVDCVMVILESLDSEGVQIYPKDLRGSKLREVRMRQGKSAGWVATMTGLSKTTIYDIEKGIKKPRIATLEKIAKVLRVDVDALG